MMDHSNRLDQLKINLENIRQEKIKGIILRAKIQWMEEGEKPTKFFASLEKKNYTNKLINKINIGGDIINNQKTILSETSKFYQDLYTTKTNPNDYQDLLDTFLSNTHIRHLDEDQKQGCEGNITTDEIKQVLKNMKPDKTPGIDGIPMEFYKLFWTDIGHFLVRSVQAAFETGELSITQKRGIITCIPKGNKPRDFF